MMRRLVLLLVAASLLLVPTGVRAQCAIERIASGVRAYRDLELERAQELMREALESQRRVSSTCATEGARALTYLGASYWLLSMPDSAVWSFERAVILAPRFEPDEFEFPPDITATFDRVKGRTPSIAVTIPDEAVIGPRAGVTLPVELTASTPHRVTATLRAQDGDHLRTLYEGPVASGAGGIVLEWDGRGATGEPVGSGRYDVEIVSADSLSRPLRKVIVPLSVESDAPEAPVVEPVDSAIAAALAPPSQGGGGLWSALAVAGAGLAAGALVAAVPPAIDGFPESDVRWAVGASLGVAGILGFAQRLRRGRAANGTPVSPDRAAPAPGRGERDAAPPTLRIRVGVEQRVELPEGVAAGPAPGWTPPRLGGAGVGH
jgi:hypothetical protein